MKMRNTIDNNPWWALFLVGVIGLLSPLGAACSADHSETYGGMPVGFTKESAPYLGDPNAPVTLEEWSDYLCPYCGRYFHQTLPVLLEKYVSTGQVKLVFRDLPIAALHPTATQGHVAARCVAEQGASRYWAMHDELFRDQQRWNGLPDPVAYLAETAEKVGADMTAYQQCIASGRAKVPVEQSVAAGQALGFQGTPSFRFIDGKSGDAYTLVGAQPLDAFVRRADALIAGEKPPEDPKPEPPELPVWAKPEGLSPDPNRPGYTMAGDQYKGDPKAKLVVIEFTDFQCSHCRRHALETQSALDEQFVQTGKVQWVIKHFPLRIHDHAAVAAVAAECAADQGKFWDMYHLLYERMDDWSQGDVEAALTGLAAQLKLDAPAFESCFNSRKALERVLKDLYDAQGVIKRAPTFVVVYSGTGTLLRGAMPADQFASALEKLLEKATTGEKVPAKPE